MITTPTTAAVQAAQMVNHWHHGDVLGTLTMVEGHTLAALFEQLGHSDTATHILREVWTAEPADARDPLPWVNAHGARLDDDAHTVAVSGDGDERFRFAPRATFEDEADVAAYRAERECANCAAYEGPLHTANGVTLCAVCAVDA